MRRRERRAVVAANRRREAKLLKRPLEHREGVAFFGRREGVFNVNGASSKRLFSHNGFSAVRLARVSNTSREVRRMLRHVVGVGLVLSVVVASAFAAAGGQAKGQSKDDPVRVGRDVAAPRVTKRVAPVYPADASRGTVILEATVSPIGNVDAVKVIRELAGATDAAVVAVRQWEFEPLIFNGQPVWCVVAITVPNPWNR
jgi:TonB family protein